MSRNIPWQKAQRDQTNFPFKVKRQQKWKGRDPTIPLKKGSDYKLSWKVKVVTVWNQNPNVMRAAESGYSSGRVGDEALKKVKILHYLMRIHKSYNSRPWRWAAMFT